MEDVVWFSFLVISLPGLVSGSHWLQKKNCILGISFFYSIFSEKNVCYIGTISYKVFFHYFFLIFRERRKPRERERERNINVREKHWVVPTPTRPNPGLNPKPRHVPWWGVEPAAFHFVGNGVQPTEPHWSVLSLIGLIECSSEAIWIWNFVLQRYLGTNWSFSIVTELLRLSISS